MRASGWLLGVAAVGAIFGMVGAGCGGSSQNNPTDAGAADATKDQGVPDTGMPEAAMEAAAMDSAMACATDADITMLNLPDAEIGDSGASTDECYACIQTTCGSQLAACNADCTCKTDVVTFLGCVAAGGTPVSCGSSLVGNPMGPGLPLAMCIAGSASGFGTGPGCLKECGVTLPDGGFGDGGQMGDAATTDAASDASGD